MNGDRTQEKPTQEQMRTYHSSWDIKSPRDSFTPAVVTGIQAVHQLPSKTNGSGPMDSPWPMQSYNSKHLGRSPYSTANNSGIEKWRASLGWIKDTPVIDKDGIIYFGGARGDNPDYIFALYPNGRIKWFFETDGLIAGSSPAIAEDGTLYVGTWKCSMFAINPDGTEKWRAIGLGGSIASSPAIAPNGTIYIGTMRDNGQLIALNPNGTLQWQYFTGGVITSSPAIADDGTIYIGSTDDYLYAVYPNGTLRWRFQTGNWIQGPISINTDGTVYFGSWDGYLYALYPNNGTMKWRCAIGYGTRTNPSIGPDGTIYVGGEELYAVNPDGTLKWNFALGTNRVIGLSSPAISSDGIIYVGINVGNADGGEIIAVNPDGTEQWRKWIANNWIDSSPSIGQDGIVYIGTVEDITNGYLYALGGGPLQTDANGPYTGFTGLMVQFAGSVSGGILPYKYHWDFGDGSTSTQQNPTHNYTDAGNYTANFTVTDSDENHSSDTANVTISYANPSVSITKPINGIYLNNNRILPFSRPLIIGPITIEATASQVPFGIDHVTFSINNRVRFTDTEAPYSWTWSSPSLFKHTITVIAYDKSGGSTSANLLVSKFF